MTNEMIPISEIDSLLEEIERLVNAFRQPDTAYQYLEKLRHKAIPAIPISDIQEVIDLLNKSNYNETVAISMAIKRLEDLKK